MTIGEVASHEAGQSTAHRQAEAYRAGKGLVLGGAHVGLEDRFALASRYAHAVVPHPDDRRPVDRLRLDGHPVTAVADSIRQQVPHDLAEAERVGPRVYRFPDLNDRLRLVGLDDCADLDPDVDGFGLYRQSAGVGPGGDEEVFDDVGQLPALIGDQLDQAAGLSDREVVSAVAQLERHAEDRGYRCAQLVGHGRDQLVFGLEQGGQLSLRPAYHCDVLDGNDDPGQVERAVRVPSRGPGQRQVGRVAAHRRPNDVGGHLVAVFPDGHEFLDEPLDGRCGSGFGEDVHECLLLGRRTDQGDPGGIDIDEFDEPEELAHFIGVVIEIST